MTLSDQLEFVHEIRSPGNVFFEIYGSKKDYLPKICPEKLPIIQLLEGNWGEVGCTLSVHYLIEGKTVITKEIVEAVDKDNMSITYNLLEGDLLKLYKSLRITFKLTSEGEKNFINWTYEYEKQNEDVPAPDNLFDFAREVTNLVDAHYIKNASLTTQA